MKTKSRVLKTHQPCPCGNSSDAYSIFEDGTGFCHGKCGGKYFPNKDFFPQSDTLGRNEEYHYEYLSRRGISKAAHEFYGVKAKINSTSGEAISVSYPYGNGSKVRSCREKKFHTVGQMSDPGCFGVSLFSAGSAKSLTITEGEDDALAVWDMLGGYPAISITSAANAIRDVKHDYDKINSFERIYLALDNDEPGRKAANEIASIFGFQKVYHVKCAPHKDPQEFLEAGKRQVFRDVWFNSERFLPDGVVSSYRQIEEELNNAGQRQRWPTPFSELNYLLGGGLETHRSYLVSGLTGIGKTEFFRAIQHELFTKTDDNIGILHFEEPLDETITRAASYALQTPAHMPESHVTKQKIMETWKSLAGREDRVHFVQHFGSEEPDTILAKIRFLVAACQCKYIFLDNITVLGTGRVQDDERKELDYLSTKLEMLVKELPFCLVFISHENEQEGTRGSQNINKVVDVWINLKRNVQAENEYARSLLYISLNKNRQASRTGPAGRARYDLATGVLSEETNELPV